MTMIDEILDEVNRLDIEATPKPWRWWTSCSHRRLSSDATGRDGDVLHGFVHPVDRQPDVVCSEADRALIAAYRSYAPALLRLRSVLANVLKEQPEREADPIFDPRLGDTCFAVEATSFEKLALWEEWHNKVEWVPDLSGLAPMIGHFGGMPIVLNLFWSRIGGIRVLFWQHVSMVTHSRMAEEWLHANCGACCEYVIAANFHTVIHAIRATNGLTAENPLHAEADASRLRAMLEKVSNYLETATRICEESGEDEEDIRDSMELVAEARALLEETK